MKRSVFIMALFFLLCKTAGAQGLSLPRPAEEVLDSACRQAGRENKNVFVMFHASWCMWCRRMDTSMNDPSCRKYFRDSYVIVHLVVDESKGKEQLENPGAAAMKTRYHGDGSGIPFWLVFNKDGKLLADSKIRKEGEGPEDGINAGCPATKEEVEYFIKVLQKTSSITEEELEIIRVRFRKNDS